MQLVLAPLAAAGIVRAAFMFAAFAAVLSASWAFPHAQFPLNNFSLGFALLLVAVTQWTVGQGLMATYRGSLRLPTSGSAILDKHPLAPLVRWSEAQRTSATAVRFSGNIAMFQLSERISHRMMRLALSHVLRSLRHRVLSAVDHGEPPAPLDKPGPGDPHDEDLYVEVHRALSATWRSRVSQTNFSSALVVSALTALVCSCIVMVSGGCLPALYPIFFAYLVLGLALVDLLNLAASNGQVNSVRALYHAARRELRELPDPPDAELRRAAARHDARLSGYLEDPGIRGKFLGLTVDYGVVRTVVVTTITLIVGIWSILRGLGVRMTMDFACT
ncbi:hypothetical protein DFJ74DRAFT_775042 [Hyaloraphidium curvatum]|nr:hypothetical protein DFJ74DRAFT_775042 [Hyaloraphidium curvatum]